MFPETVTSCKIFKNGILSQNVATYSLSGKNIEFVFDPYKSTLTDNFELFCTLSNGLTISRFFRI